MDRAIRITAGSVSAEARLNDSKTAGAIWEALPIEGKGQTWGDEIYFDIGLTAPAEKPREVVDVGDLAYWPPCTAICIFFGPTPVSRVGECRPSCPVNVVVKVVGAAAVFRNVGAGTRAAIARR